MSKETRIMLYCTIMAIIASLASLAVFLMMGYQFVLFPTPQIISPSISVPTITSTTVSAPVYNFDSIAEDYFDDNKDVELCLSLYPELDLYSYNKHLLYWNETTNPTIINVTIYPEVSVSNPDGRVIFTAYEANVQKWIPTENGRETQSVDITDPIYNQMLTNALKKTNGNRGYKASWMVTLVNGNPNNYASSGSCSPIPY